MCGDQRIPTQFTVHQNKAVKSLGKHIFKPTEQYDIVYLRDNIVLS